MQNNEVRLKIINYIKAISAFLPALFWGTLILGFEGEYMAFTTVVCALIHELGHIAYLVFFAPTSHSIKSVVFGLKIRAVRILSYKDELFLYAFGPLSNLVFGTLFLILSKRFGDYFSSLSIINFATAISNLLPIDGYDGYGIIRVLLEERFSGGQILNVLSSVSAAIVFTLCIFSIYLINRYGGGYWIFIVFFVQMIKHFQKRLK